MCLKCILPTAGWKRHLWLSCCDAPSSLHSTNPELQELFLFIQTTTDGAHEISLLGRYTSFALTPSENEFATYSPLPLIIANFYQCLKSPFYICVFCTCSSLVRTNSLSMPVHWPLCSLLKLHFQSAKHALLLPGRGVQLWWMEASGNAWSSPRKQAFSIHMSANLENEQIVSIRDREEELLSYVLLIPNISRLKAFGLWDNWYTDTFFLISQTVLELNQLTLVNYEHFLW